MNFEKHLFVSYAHVDDLAAPGDDQGWVTRFDKYLETYLSQSMGEQAKVWRDDRLRGNDIFANEIVKQFPETAVLLSIVSPRYIESEWCLREVNEFCKTAELNGGLTIDNKARVLRVMLRRLPSERREQLPNILKNALGYEFYQEVDGSRELPLDPSFGSGEAYRRQVYFLAEDIADLVSKLKHKDSDAESAEVASKPKVYLAECSYDLRDDREKLRGDLRAHGYTVLPDQLARLPDLESEYVTEAGRLLDQCQVSVHLVGRFRGKVPDGSSQKSVVQLQNEVAAAKCEKSGLRRVIWLPENAHSEQAEQQAFIDELQKDASLQRGADLVTDDLEAFKGVVHATLRKLEKPAPETSQPATTAKLVYLICDHRDRPATIPLRKFLKGEGVDVVIPVFEGDAATVRQANQDLMTRCDAVVLFYGAGDEAWKRTVDNDLIKMKAYRDGKPLQASHVYLAPPVTDDKQELIELEESNLIRGLDGFKDSEMQSFLNLLKS
jgi:TIR domain